jgi:tellurite resistance protein TerC
MVSTGTTWLWIGFFIFVALVVCIDVFMLGGKKTHRVSTREALAWVLVWFSCAMLFNAVLYFYVAESRGVAIAAQKAQEFFTGYLIEYSLSIDNMFAFIMIFHYFRVPAEYQRRVLLYGVLSAIIMRLLIILGGTWLVSELHWILYIVGLFLIFTGIKMMLPEQGEKDLGKNPFLRWIRKHMRVTEHYHEERFFIKQHAMWYATPLFLALILIEFSDLVFALDSIPAIFAVTNDVFIIFTSNIFAILGLRALYFLLANTALRFQLLKYGIAIVLTFVGAKMLIEPWYNIPIGGALGVVVAILATTMVINLLYLRSKRG